MAFFLIFDDQIFQIGFEKWDVSGFERFDFVGVDVEAVDVIAKVRKNGSSDYTDETRTDDGNVHGGNNTRFVRN